MVPFICQGSIENQSYENLKFFARLPKNIAESWGVVARISAKVRPRFCSHALLAPCASQYRGLRYSGSHHTRAGTHQASAC